MQAYTELLPPSAVTHAVSLPFTSPSSRNLVVAKTSLLQIFRVFTLPHETHARQINGTRPEFETHGSSTTVRQRLALVGEYPVSGTITSLAAIKALGTKSGGEALLVASRDAKISLVEWDPEAHSLSTLSIHFYEGEQLQGSPWTPELSHWPCYLTADPSSRCAALQFGQRHIAILPFRQVGDDLVMADEDPDIDEPNDQPRQDQQLNGNAKAHQTPYSASFVLPLTALDPSIIHPISMAFLYEYREPTLGVLSCSIGGAASMMRKDVMTYTAFTLDLEQKARTPLLSVSGLPSDLFKLVPLPLPVGGALLIGANELVHVDQAGKTHGIGVNEYSKQSSSFAMTDQSELSLRLEGCVVAPLSTGAGDMVLFLIDGTLAILTFRMDGRSVSGLGITPVPIERGGSALGASASCAVALGHGTVFAGSDDADAIVLSCSSPDGQLARKRSHADVLADEDEEDSDEDVEDDDDLYANDSAPTRQVAAGTSAIVNLDDVRFVVQVRLLNVAMAAEASVGRTILPSYKSTNPERQQAHLMDVHLAAPVGRGRAGGLAILKHSIRLREQRDLTLTNVHRVWSVKMRPSAPNKGDQLPMPEYDGLLVTSHTNAEGLETSAIYTINDAGIQARDDSDFENDTGTVDIGVMQDGSRLVQVSKSELRSYDPALDFPQIVPMSDEETDAELKITHTSFADPYVLILRDDSSVCILQMDKKGELEELDKHDEITSNKWSSGSLHHVSETDEVFAFLLTVEDSIHIFRLPDLSRPIVTYDGFPHLPPYIHREYARRRMAARVNFRELLVTDFGDAKANTPHLVIRTSNDDIVCYQSYQYPASDNASAITANTRWRKVLNTYATVGVEDDEVATESARNARMKILNLPHDCRAILVPGATPKCILKRPSTGPIAVDIAGDERLDLSSLHTPSCPHGFAVVNLNGQVSMAQVPSDLDFAPGGWTARRMLLGCDVDAAAFHAPSGLYALGTNQPMDFKLIEDDWHPEWAKEAEASFKPHVARGTVSLFHPDTASIIDSIELLPYETLLCLQVLSLEVSEHTQERKLLVAAGTAVIQGEDSACNGGIYVFEVVSVVPELDRPETNFKLRQIVREDVRGAVSAISAIGNQGFLLHAQGQKCMVRGLKEDDSLLPVAFMDMQCYVSVLKGLNGTGLALMGDAVKGLWLAGYSPEPYRMQLFGKSRPRLDVLAADFLPDNKQLFMAVVDATCNMHILEFNPEDPKSLSGQRLLQRSTFHTGHLPVSAATLPTSYHASAKHSAGARNGTTDADSDGDETMPDVQKAGETLAPSHQVLITSSSGSIALLTPLPEAVYRRLGALQTHLSNVLEHAAGLNPRAYRAVESEGFGSRGVLDGSLLRRWGELSVQRGQEALARAGTEGWELRADFEVLRGRGLGF